MRWRTDRLTYISVNYRTLSLSFCSQAVVADRTVYVSGCLGLDKQTMKLVPGGAAEQTEMALKNLEAVLKAADSDINKVIKNTVFLKDLNDFGAVNEVYKRGEILQLAGCDKPQQQHGAVDNAYQLLLGMRATRKHL